MNSLTEKDLIRYRRQIIIEGIGETGQQKLKEARVVIVGAGGLGSPVSMYLAVAGIGRITIADGDKVDLSNLNRQLLHWDKDIGKNKMVSAVEKLRELNPDIEIAGINKKVTEENVEEILSNADAVVDCLDNFPSRFILNRAAFKLKIPFFHGACYGFDGRVSTFIPGKTPCLECIIPAIPPPEEIPVIGVTPGVIGSIEATEVIKYFVGLEPLLANKLLLYDGWNLIHEKIDIHRRPDCPCCGTGEVEI